MLNEFRSTSITWDKATSRIYSPVTANESDENGRKLVVQIVNSGQVEDLTGATLHLYWVTRDKSHDGLDVFEAVDLKKGEFELSYTTGMLSNQGVLNANLVLIDTVGRVVSERFKITVTEGIDNDAIQSENSFSSLTKALIDISNLEQNYAPRLNDLTAQLQQTEQSLNAQLEHLTFPAPPKPTFVIVDDDSTVGVINTLEPILDSYGIKGNIAVITSNLDTGGWFMYSSQVKRLYDKGWNVLSHTHTHAFLPDETENTIRSEMLQSKNTLKNIGVEVNHIVYPGNRVDDKVARIAKDYFQSGLSAYSFADDDTSGINKSPIATYNMARIGIGAWGTSDLVLVKRVIDATIKINGLLIFMTHVGENTEEHNNELKEIIEYVLNKGYTFDTYEEAFEKHKNVIEQGEYRVANNGYDFAVGKNGNMNMRGLRMKKLDANAINSATNPRFFGVNSDTYCEITSENATGFPTGNSGITQTVVHKGTHLYGTQFYKPHSSNSIYFRDVLTLTSWGEWKKQSDEMVEKPLFNAPPGAYLIGTNTFTYGSAEVNVEGVYGGTLTTIRPDYGQGYAYQIHRVYDSTKLYIRTQKAGKNEWGAFQEITTTQISKNLPFNAHASEYNRGTTVKHYLNAEVSGLGSPNGRGGTLTTVKPSDIDLLYTYQVYKDHGVNLLYYRSFTNPTAAPASWSDWKEL